MSVKGILMILTFLFLQSTTAIAETINRDVLLDLNYTINTNNTTGNLTFFYPNGTLIKTTIFNIETNVSSSVQAITNLSITYWNASGGTVDCGDQTINLPAISCQPVYNYYEQPCPSIPSLPNCSLTCPPIDNEPLIHMIDGLKPKEETDNTQQYIPWAIAAMLLLVVIYLYFNKKKNKPKDENTNDYQQVNLQPITEPQQLSDDFNKRPQALPITRFENRAPVIPQPRSVDFNTVEMEQINQKPLNILNNFDMLERPPVQQFQQPAPLKRQVANPDIDALRTEMERADKRNSIRQKIETNNEEEPIDERQEKINAKLKLLKRIGR